MLVSLTTHILYPYICSKRQYINFPQSLSVFSLTLTSKQSPSVYLDLWTFSSYIMSFCCWVGGSNRLVGSLTLSSKKLPKKRGRSYLNLLIAPNYIHIVDFTLFNISFVFLWNIIFLLSFSFSTSSNLFMEKKIHNRKRLL